jgi:oligopeptide/dipeptide ABC transporter ATP-binding protein
VANTGLEIVDLTVEFRHESGVVRAVDGVSLNVRPNETLGVVGESGSGKSVTALSVLRLIPDPPGRIVSGRILVDGEDVLALSPHRMRKIRGSRASMIFQEPMTSLNPVFTVGEQVAEVFRIHRGVGRREAHGLAGDMLEKVGISDARQKLDDYPHRLSGGMRQRVMIAMALACNPHILLADEPTTALDVTIQAQILELLKTMQRDTAAGILLISHDMGLVAEACDRVAVMYAGQVVEHGCVDSVFNQPLHPYTQGLLHSLPELRTRPDQPKRTRLRTIEGVVPDLAALPRGCHFRPRCPQAMSICATDAPPLINLGGCSTRCWLYESDGPTVPPAVAAGLSPPFAGKISSAK